jgi:hypothetical protein
MVSTAPRTRRRTVIVEEADTSDLLLQDILELPQPERTNTLVEWLEAGQYDNLHGGTVKLVTNNKKPMQFNMNGQPFHVPPAGKRVSRDLALRLLMLYGASGRYYGRDQRTGMPAGEEDMLSEHQEKWAARQKFNFIKQYLMQAPEKAAVPGQDRPAWEEAVVDVIPDDTEDDE